MRTGDAVITSHGKTGIITGCDYWNPEYGPMAMIRYDYTDENQLEYELVPQLEIHIREELDAPDLLSFFSEEELAAANEYMESACQL
jgi:hypothetical protein